MTLRIPSGRQVAFCIVLAFCFWAAVFAFQLVNFWLGLSAAALILTGLSFFWAGIPLSRKEITVYNTVLALLSVAALYALFYFGRNISMLFFPFAGEQISAIYGIREEANPGVIVFVLLFITSPCEEVFWRGFVQRYGMKRFGPRLGWLFASFFYTAIHISSGNVMLTGAAMTAGLFWGYVYMRAQSLYICILSHAAWTVSVFLLFPLA